MSNIHFLLMVLIALLSQSASQQCDVMSFETWNVVHFYGNSVFIKNLGKEINHHPEIGTVFRSEASSYVLPSVTSLIDSGRNAQINSMYQIAVRELRSIDGGIPWLKVQISEEIRTWATKADQVSHQGNDVPSQPFGDRREFYGLPDGRSIYLTAKSQARLVDQWATHYRPGDF